MQVTSCLLENSRLFRHRAETAPGGTLKLSAWTVLAWGSELPMVSPIYYCNVEPSGDELLREAEGLEDICKAAGVPPARAW